MTNTNDITRIEAILTNSLELDYVKKNVYNNIEIEDIFNTWLSMEGEHKVTSLKEMIISLVHLDIDMLKDGWDIFKGAEKVAYENDITGELSFEVFEKTILPIFNNGITFEVEQYTEEDEDGFTCFNVYVKLTPEQELFFKLFKLDKYLLHNTRQVAYVYYNGINSDYNY